MILAGDIGGTKTRLALFPPGPGRSDPVSERTYVSREYPGLEVIAREFVRASGVSIDRACFGVAGPVKDGRSSTTNLAWVVDARELARDLRLARVYLLNDLEASAHGLPALRSDETVVLQEGIPGAAGNQALIAAGTGLGEAALYWDGRGHRPFATEGGHASFAPTDDTQIDLLASFCHHDLVGHGLLAGRSVYSTIVLEEAPNAIGVVSQSVYVLLESVSNSSRVLPHAVVQR